MTSTIFGSSTFYNSVWGFYGGIFRGGVIRVAIGVFVIVFIRRVRGGVHYVGSFKFQDSSNVSSMLCWFFSHVVGRVSEASLG